MKFRIITIPFSFKEDGFSERELEFIINVLWVNANTQLHTQIERKARRAWQALTISRTYS